MILLDTHIWVWWLGGHAQLSVKERTGLDRLAARGELALSLESVIELERLERRGRLVLDRRFDTWLGVALDPAVVKVISPDLKTVMVSRSLGEGFHPDPSDRLIVATALQYGMRLATHDQRIIGSRAVAIWAA